MKITGKKSFSMEAEGTEKGEVRNQGEFSIALTGLTMPLKTDVRLEKDDANIVIGLGGITTVKFLHILADFDDDTVANADVEFLVNDGGGEVGITGKSMMLEDTDLTSLKLTNNSHDSTGSDATVFIDLAGD